MLQIERYIALRCEHSYAVESVSGNVFPHECLQVGPIRGVGLCDFSGKSENRILTGEYKSRNIPVYIDISRSDACNQ